MQSSNHTPWYLPEGTENVCPLKKKKKKKLHKDGYRGLLTV